MNNQADYHRAYIRQKAAREKAEALLESRARELYESNESLRTALEELQKQKSNLVQQEKLASIGLLASGIAHEINNPVGFVKSNLQTLLNYLTTLTKPLSTYLRIADELASQPLPNDLKLELQKINLTIEQEDVRFVATDSIDSINECLTGIERVEDIIYTLKDYSHKGSDKKSFLDVNAVINNALKLISNELKYKCEITKDFGDVPITYSSSGQLSQIFVNLAMNAAQAMNSRGNLKITTYCDTEHIYVLFADDGEGIDENALSRLFDPFFTTKDIGAGTG
ncbi:MAG: sensor histidine kinase, partial [Pseudohongiellaceae bacterium]